MDTMGGGFRLPAKGFDAFSAAAFQIAAVQRDWRGIRMAAGSRERDDSALPKIWTPLVIAISRKTVEAFNEPARRRRQILPRQTRRYRVEGSGDVRGQADPVAGRRCRASAAGHHALSLRLFERHGIPGNRQPGGLQDRRCRAGRRSPAVADIVEVTVMSSPEELSLVLGRWLRAIVVVLPVVRRLTFQPVSS